MKTSQDGDVWQPQRTKAHTWTLGGPKGTIVSINLETGEHKFGENYTPDEAAHVFWRTVWQRRAADDEELAKEFERRNPHDCYVACVEMPILEIISKLREISGA